MCSHFHLHLPKLEYSCSSISRIGLYTFCSTVFSYGFSLCVKQRVNLVHRMLLLFVLCCVRCLSCVGCLCYVLLDVYVMLFWMFMLCCVECLCYVVLDVYVQLFIPTEFVSHREQN